MKKLFCLLTLCFGVAVADAQITTGESTSKVIRTGNRAKAGNFGIYVGGTTDMFRKIGDSDVNFSAMPLINLKYMYTDNLEFRLGLEWWKESSSQEMKVVTGEDEEGNETTEKSERKSRESQFMFYPGVAYHFSNKNLLDVYVGAELPIGWGTIGTGDRDDDYNSSCFNIGLGAFIGLQAYIGNLPLAVGVEYGISGLHTGISDGTLTSADGQTANVSYRDLSLKNVTYAEDVKESKWKLGQQVRFTLSYYFNL